MSKVKLAFVDVLGVPFDGALLDKRGVGGTESAIILMAREMAKIGFDVKVFNNCTQDGCAPGGYDGVEYIPLEELPGWNFFDVVVSSQSIVPFVPLSHWSQIPTEQGPWILPKANLFDFVRDASYRVVWAHSTFFPYLDHMVEPMLVEGYIDRLFTHSDFHTHYLTNAYHGHRRNFEVLKRKVWLTRAGVEPQGGFVDISSKDPDLFISNSSAVKGMETLIYEIWPRLVEKIPNAKLIAIGGYYNVRPGVKDSNIEAYEKMKNWSGNRNVTFTGIIPQKEVFDILRKASFQLSPSAFPETFGRSILEAEFFNTPVITCRFGGAEEVAVENASYKLEYPVEANQIFTMINRHEQIDKFVALTIEAYKNRYLWEQKANYCSIVKNICTWDTIALQWKQHFYNMLGMYLPEDEYHKAMWLNERVNRVFDRRFMNEENYI